MAMKFGSIGKLGVAAKSGVDRAVMGVLIGAVTGLVWRKTPTGDPFYGFKGTFEAAIVGMGEGKNAVAAETVTDGVLFLPAALSDPIKALIDVEENAPASVEFAYEIAAKKKADGKSYEYDIRPIVAPRPGDVLASLRAQIAAGTAQAVKAKAK